GGFLCYERFIAAAIGQNAASQVDVVERLRAGHARAPCDSGHQLRLSRGDLVLSVELCTTLCCRYTLDLAGVSQLTAICDKPSLAIGRCANARCRCAYKDHQEQK